MIKEADLAKEMKNGVPGGLYFFYGDEDYTKNRRAADMKRAAVGEDPSLAAFNCFEFVFGDGEFDAAAVEDALLAPPMMSPKKFISMTFSSVDSLKTRGKAGDGEDGEEDDSTEAAAPKKGGKTQNRLMEYLKSVEDPGEDTVMVVKAVGGGFDPGTAKAPSPFLRDADKIMTCVEFPYQSDNRLIHWMERHFADYGLTAAPEVYKWILNAAGKSMYRLSGELAKTAAYAAYRAEGDGSPRVVTLEDARLCVAANDEDDAFGLANCIMDGDLAGALNLLRIKMALREEPLLILGQISRAISDLYAAAAFSSDGRDASDYAAAMKMHSYRAGLFYRAVGKNPPSRYAEALNLCLEADRRLKSGLSGSSNSYAPIERLICSLTSLGNAAPGNVSSGNNYSGNAYSGRRGGR